MLGVSALVVASETAYTALKLCGAVVLIAYGVQAIWRARTADEPATAAEPSERRSACRIGLLTALSNPKVALFYVALLPQFVPSEHAVLPATLLFAGIQIALSCAWYFVPASAVGRAREAFARHRSRIQALSGAVMVGFGLRVLATTQR